MSIKIVQISKIKITKELVGDPLPFKKWKSLNLNYDLTQSDSIALGRILKM